MLAALTILLAHGFGHVRQTSNGDIELVLTFTPLEGESLLDLHNRIEKQRCANDTVSVAVKGGRIAKFDLIRHISS